MAPPLIDMISGKPMVLATVLLLQAWVLSVQSVELNLFYPFGAEHGDKLMKPMDDGSSIDVRVEEEFFLFNNSYRNIYVNTNGHISFDSEFPAYRIDMALPLGYHLVAPFYADVDTRAGGNIFYRNTSDKDVIQRAAADIQTYFDGYQNYMPTTLFIVTWDRVGYFDQKSDLTNTFQLILASDGQNTFSLFHYLDNGINWQRSDGKFAPTYQDIPPQAGFDGGVGGEHYLLPGSAETGAFVTGSNVNVPGVWMFHIGGLVDGNIRIPSLNIEDVVSVTLFKPKVQTGCAQAAGVCHANAKCVEHSNGFCCECISPSYGNGFECAERGVPQTLNSRVYGSVNGVTFSENDKVFMHTYVKTVDGRTYSAISGIPSSIGTAMETLNSIGGIIGWVFAKAINPQVKNGYMLTGGKFNRTAKVTFKNPTGDDQVVHIRQVFFGHQGPSNTKLETYINGDLPTFPLGAAVKIDDYMENYRKKGKGLITSNAARTFRVDNVAHRYIWENTITYDECDDGMPDQGPMVSRLSVGKHYVRHNVNDRVVRYAMTSKIGLAGDSDPCSSLGKQCHEKAECVANGDTFVCTCINGYYGDGARCADVDECRQNMCDRNARCQNMPGTFRCQCNPGYIGNGRTCQPEVALCGTYVCDANARCVFDPALNERRCECVPGFRGDGQRCSVLETNCRNADICGDNAQCVYDDILREYVCECLDDFSGDGYSCEAVDPGCNGCDPHADCVTNGLTFKESCQCKSGFTGNGQQCSMIDVCSMCDSRAQCVFDDRNSEYRCVCVRGYRGSGESCEPVDCRNETNMCATEGGLCWLNPATDIAICRCNIGYRGDGFRCEKVSCDVYNDCDTNAKCVSRSGQYVCECNPGFIGAGRRCRPDESATCDVYNFCDSNARCTPDSNSPPNYYCECNAGYQGDGKRCRTAAPCNEVNYCDRNAACVFDSEESGYKCMCNEGYKGNGMECQRRAESTCTDYNDCDRNARCKPGLEDPTLFFCQCNAGFRGDGKRCEGIAPAESTCTDVNDCDGNARCSPGEDDPSLLFCQCNPGFRGDGKRCEPVFTPDEKGCTAHSDCHTNGRCVPNPSGPSRYICECSLGFSGDGRQCERITEAESTCTDYNDCDRNARCKPGLDDPSLFFCQCNAGFRGDGKRCAQIASADSSCTDYNDCDRNARCSPGANDPSLFYCQCNPGFRGDGKHCDAIFAPDVKGCTAHSDCHTNGRCAPSTTGQRGYACQCNPGFRGDGKKCEAIVAPDVNSCTAHSDCHTNGRCAPSTTGQRGYACQCNPGFRGDGKKCEAIGRDDTTCTDYNDCDRNARCVPGRGDAAVYSCQCNPGFKGNGKQCTLIGPDPTSCPEYNDCDRNARCFPTSDPSQYTCQCNPGFRGNGKQCEATAPATCKQLNNCDPNAACVYNPDAKTYQCACNRGFDGNGQTCRKREVPDCRRDSRLCARDADCVKGAGDAYVCICKPGFRGNGNVCSYVVSEGDKLIYAQGSKLMQVSVDPQPGDIGKQIAYLKNQLAVGIDIDCKEKHIYWTDVANGVIHRSDMEGEGMKTVISGLKSPEGVAIDHSARNIFFTDSELDVLQVATLDGASVKTLVDTDMVNPRAVVLDISRGTVFWTDWNRQKPQIEKINMDGSDRSILVYNNLRLPNGLAYDSYSQLLCWGDAGEKRIECVLSDGTGRRVITTDAPYPFDVTMMNNNIFWSDWKKRDLPSVDQNGKLNQPLTLALGGHGRLYGIAAVRNQCPRARNSCEQNNGGCKFLCLSTPNGGRTCACPDGTDPRLC